MRLKNDLTEEQKKLSYAKYYYMPMAPIPEEKLALLKRPIDPSKALKVEDCTKLIKPGYTEGDNGYCTMYDGTGYLANLTFIPDGTIEMLHWWFIWHSLETTRYKIWDPEDHISISNLDREMSLDQSIPINERSWRQVHISEEYFTDDENEEAQLPAKIIFFRPGLVGFDESVFGVNKGLSAICGRTGGFSLGINIIREVEGGVEYRSIKWLGYDIVDGKIVKSIPECKSFPIEKLKGLYEHVLREYTHLAWLLPRVYAEEMGNW